MCYLLKLTIKDSYVEYFTFDTLKRLNLFLVDIGNGSLDVGLLSYDITDISIYKCYKHKRSHYFKNKYKEYFNVA